MSTDDGGAQVLYGLLKINLEPGASLEVEVVPDAILVVFDFDFREQPPLMLTGEQAWQLSKALDIAQKAAGFRDFAQTGVDA